MPTLRLRQATDARVRAVAAQCGISPYHLLELLLDGALERFVRHSEPSPKSRTLRELLELAQETRPHD